MVDQVVEQLHQPQFIPQEFRAIPAHDNDPVGGHSTTPGVDHLLHQVAEVKRSPVELQSGDVEQGVDEATQARGLLADHPDGTTVTLAQLL
jgi:hypothetical protein